MANFGDELVAYLQAQATITALVGARFDPTILRSSTYPAIVYRRVDTPQLVASYVRPRYQFDLYGPDYDALWTLADRMRTALHEYHGLMGSTHVRCGLSNVWDDYDPELGLFVTRMDARLLFVEPSA